MPSGLVKALARAVPPVRRLHDAVIEANAENLALRRDLEATKFKRDKIRDALDVATGAKHTFCKLMILLTSRCNFTCVMCNSIHLAKATLTEKEVRNLIQDADTFGFDQIEISGGEPYYLKYFSSVIEDFAGKISPTIRVLTNAYSLDEKLIDRLAGRPRLSFQVSFDGTGDVHNWIRVQKRYDAFSKSDRNLRLLSQAGLGVSVQTVIQRHNVGNLLETYRHFRDVPYLHHGFGIVEEGSWDYENNYILPEQSEALADELEEIMVEARADHKPIGLGENMIDHLRERSNEAQQEEFPLHPGYGCTVPYSIVIVDQDTLVYPCFHYHPITGHEHREMVAAREYQGQFSIKGRRLADVIFSPAYLERSRRMTQIDGCEGCTTTCYFNDDNFKRKSNEPNLEDLRLRDAQREFLRRYRAEHTGSRSVAPSERVVAG